MKKFEFCSESLVQENVSKLAELFPECVTEVLNEDNKLVKQVDFNVLKSLLKESIIEGDKERYQFTWPGKQAARDEAFTSIDKSLRPCKEESVNFDTTENLYIEGDNLAVLKLLRHTYHGKIKMIYIDPPYNTGSDFVYNDKFKQTKAEYDETSGEFDELGNRLYTNTAGGGQFHSNWLNMMYPRLLLARDLLSKDGVIFISIDDNELSNLQKICNEILGKANFLAILNWKGRGGKQDSKYYAIIHEYILVYAKNIAHFEAGEEIKEEGVYPKFDTVKQRYYKTSLLRKWGSTSKRSDRPNLFYPIPAPDGSPVYPMLSKTEEGRWRWGKERMDKALKDGMIEFVKSKELGWIPYEKTYAPLEGEEETKKYNSWIDDISNGTSELKELFGISPFDFPKSTKLISLFIKMAGIKDGIILDFFSGSSTTAHAIMKLNAEDGGHRKFIMVQVPEKCDEKSEAYKAGYKNICEIGKERIRRAGKQILVELKEKSDGSLFTENTSIDVGFRVFKQSDSILLNMKVKPEEVDQITIKQISKFKTDKTPEDLLFYSMLELGVPLSEKVEKISIGIHSLYKVENANLIACFENNIDEAMVTEVAKMNPDYFVLREDAIDDSLINNIDSIFKVYSKSSDVEDRIRIL